MALISDWMQLGRDIFYRKPELYSMSWGGRGGMNLEDFTVAAAPLGGPIALIRKEERNIGVNPTKPHIFLFTASGSKIYSFKWTSGTLCHVGWSRSEDLVCIQEDGDVLIYDMFGNYIHTFSMGHEVKDALVQEAQVFTSFQDTGVAVLTKTNRFFVVNNINEPKARKYSDITNVRESPILCWCTLRDDRNTAIIVSQGKNLWSLSNQDQHSLNPEWNDTGERIVDVAISSNSRHIALYSESSHLWIGSSDLQTKYCEFSAKNQVKPKQLAWCGTGAIVLLWDMTLELVSVNGETTTNYLDSTAHLIQEIDSIRVIGSMTHDLLQKVPHVVVKTLGIGSMAPGALLFEASQGYQETSTRATDCLSMIKDSMEEAVLQCLQSAQHEYTPSIQKSLLRAASFGKTFVPELSPESFRTITTLLRVLNAVRDHRVGIPLTWNQLDWMTMPVLLDRLVHRRLFPLALRIAGYLKLADSDGASRILAHWACYKVKQPSQKSDDQIAKEISSKLGYTPGISYTDIANRAEKVGRKSLAIKLIEYECRPSKQVHVLLRLGEDELALKRALQGGDSDLIYLVLLELKKKLSSGDFIILIRNFPVAQSLYKRSCQQFDIDQYRDILVQEDDFHGQAILRISEAYQAKRADSQLASLQGAAERFKLAKSDWAYQMTDEQIKLFRCQVRLEEMYQKTFLGKSLHDTVFQLLKDGHLKEADKMKSDFKITEKRYCFARVLSYGESRQWQELFAFSKTKKLAIGFESFVDVCLKFDNVPEAKKYLSKIKEENKINYHVKCGLLEEAVKIAQEMRSGSGLAFISNACGPEDEALQNKIKSLMLDPSLRQ